MRPHEESHGNNFEDHFYGVDKQENEIDLVSNFGDAVDLLVDSKEEAVGKDYDQDDPVEPGVDSHNLDDPVSERICHGEAAQRNSGVVLLLRVLARSLEVSTRVVRESILD